MRGIAFAAATVALFAWGPVMAPISAAHAAGPQSAAPQAAPKPTKQVRATVNRPASPGYNCVQYVRMASSVKLSGDAWKWWDSAAGAFERGSAPRADSIMVFGRTAGMQRGHVAIVRQVVGDREMIIDHANWGNARGRVATGVRVVDVSARGDWSQVRVWHTASDVMGNKTYPIRGFVYTTPNETAPAFNENIGVQEALRPAPSRSFQLDSAVRYGG